MQTITIEITSDTDRELIQLLAKRLGLKWFVSSETIVADINDISPHLKVIEKGVMGSEKRLTEVLTDITSDRNDRTLPFQ